MSEKFIPGNPKVAQAMAEATESRSLFYGELGSNSVWGFVPAVGRAGVAICNDGAQVVISLDNLRELVKMLEKEIT